jgi:hypothetical protein
MCYTLSVHDAGEALCAVHILLYCLVVLHLLD